MTLKMDYANQIVHFWFLKMDYGKIVHLPIVLPECCHCWSDLLTFQIVITF